MAELKFIPRCEIQVREWFAAHLDDYGFNIIDSRAAFPDYILQNEDGELFRVEVEMNSSNFIQHGHDVNGCDFILCWIHDAQLGTRVLELSSGKWYRVNETNNGSDVVIDLSIRERELGIKLARELCVSDLKGKYSIFVAAYASYLDSISEYSRAAVRLRNPLVVATESLCGAFEEHGIVISGVSPEKLFSILVG